MKSKYIARIAISSIITIATGLALSSLLFAQRGNADAPPSQIKPGNLQAPGNLKEYEGQLIRDKKNSKIYWIDGGRRRHIESVPVLTRLFKAEKVENFLDTGSAEDGEKVTDNNRLLTCKEKGHPLFGRVYFFDKSQDLEKGQIRYITSPAALEQYNFNVSKIKEIDCPVLESLDDGSEISSQTN